MESHKYKIPSLCAEVDIQTRVEQVNQRRAQ